MLRTLVIIATLIVVIPQIHSAPLPKDPKAPKLEGLWRLVRYSSDGKPFDEFTLDWTISKDTIEVFNSKSNFRNTLKLTRDGKFRDSLDYSASTGEKWQSIYKIDRDQLIIVSGTDSRPTTFEPAKGVCYFEFKRVRE